MNTILIRAGGRIGRIFQGENSDTYCFVPEDCLIFEDGEMRIEEGEYMRSGWDVRNMRFNDSGDGQHLFPDLQRPVVDLDVESVKTFLTRIETVQAA